MSAYVYRCYDRAGQLIYVGATRDLWGRLTAHRNRSWWAHDVARVSAKVFPSMIVALGQERTAIASERPRWNITGRWSTRFGWGPCEYIDYFTALLRTPNVGTRAARRHREAVARSFGDRFGYDLPLLDVQEVSA